jgi:hypothetical protein
VVVHPVLLCLVTRCKQHAYDMRAMRARGCSSESIRVGKCVSESTVAVENVGTTTLCIKHYSWNSRLGLLLLDSSPLRSRHISSAADYSVARELFARKCAVTAV